MAQLSKPAIPAKMYHQFAIVTIVCTAGIALLAGGSSDAVESSQPQARSAGAPRPSATPRYGQARLKTGGSTMVADGAGFYEPVDDMANLARASSGRGNLSAISAIGASEMPMGNSENAAFTRGYLESLSDEELDELLRQLRAGGVEDPATRQQIIAVLEAGARRRAGRGSGEEL